MILIYVHFIQSQRFYSRTYNAIPPKQKHLGNLPDCTVLWAVFQQNEGEGDLPPEKLVQMLS
jgi:hypothetical protein